MSTQVLLLSSQSEGRICVAYLNLFESGSEIREFFTNHLNHTLAS